MSKKPGFQVKIGGETILYSIIAIVILGFIYFMPNIYKTISDLKTGDLFKNTNKNIVENNNQNDEENVINDNPIAETILTCTHSDSKPEGNLVETYTFYYNDDKLTQFKNEKEYDAITDEYLNYVYSEQARFNNMNQLYKEVSGFTYNSILEERNLIVIFSYDLTKLNSQLLNNADEDLSIQVNVTRNQTLEDTKTFYENLGYNCR